MIIRVPSTTDRNDAVGDGADVRRAESAVALQRPDLADHEDDISAKKNQVCSFLVCNAYVSIYISVVIHILGMLACLLEMFSSNLKAFSFCFCTFCYSGTFQACLIFFPLQS